MSEYNYITKFVNYCNSNKMKAVQPMGKNQSTYADCEILLNNKDILKVEAKMLKNTHSNSVHFYNLLGELIGVSGKNSLLQKNGCKCNQLCSAILLPYNSKSVFDKLWQKNITQMNGNKYCSNFDVKYLITFDEQPCRMRIYTYCKFTNKWV